MELFMEILKFIPLALGAILAIVAFVDAWRVKRKAKKEAERKKAKQEELNKKEIAQWEKYTEEGMPKHIFDKLNEKVLQEKEEVQQALCKAYESMPEPIDYEEKLLRFKDALEALGNPDVTPAKQNSLLKACIERIDYKREKAVLIKSQQTRYYDTEMKATRYTSPLKTGANWTNPEFELDIKLRV